MSTRRKNHPKSSQAMPVAATPSWRSRKSQFVQDGGRSDFNRVHAYLGATQPVFSVYEFV